MSLRRKASRPRAGALAERRGELELARRHMRGSMMWMIAFSVLLLGSLEFFQNDRPPRGPDLAHLRLQTGLSPADATVIVVGLVAVAAALSIALATTLTSTAGEAPRDFAARAIWSDQASLISCVITTAGLTTALTQFFNERPVRNVTQAGCLLFIALTGIWLSAAVTRWNGREELGQMANEDERDHLLRVERRRYACPTAAGPRSRDWTQCALLTALVTCATAAMMGLEALFLPGPALGLAHAHDPSWWAIVLGAPVSTGLFTTVLSVDYWLTELEPPGRFTSGLSRLMAITFMVLLVVVLLLLGLTTEPGPAIRLQRGTLFLAPAALTLLLLVRARSGSGRIPRFASQYVRRELDRRLVRLQRTPAR